MIHAVPKPQRQPKRPKVRSGPSERSRRSRGHLFPKLVKQSRRGWIRKQSCIATGVQTGEWVLAQRWMPKTLRQLCPYKARVVAAHVESRGAGKPDVGNMVPLEWKLHEWAGQIGWERFERRVPGLMSVAEIAVIFEQKFVARAAAIAKNIESGAAYVAQQGEP